MSEMATAIMDAAERRIRLGGFNGFSFRDLAEDVGVKSASVHYHFPTKEDLASAVIARYTKETAELIDREYVKSRDVVKTWTRAFRGTLHSEDRMCPCAVLGATPFDLPDDVRAQVKGFFEMCSVKMRAQGLSAKGAAHLLSTIMGALVVANAVGDMAAYDRAVSELAVTRHEDN